MINRRTIVGAAAILPGLAIAAPALACRAAAPKDQTAYRGAIDQLFDAWWRRDFGTFRRLFAHEAVERPFDPTVVFGEHFATRDERPFKRNILISGSIAVVETLVPIAADPVTGICGGMARAELFAVRFYSGLPEPIVQSLTTVGTTVLAEAEWGGANG